MLFGDKVGDKHLPPDPGRSADMRPDLHLYRWGREESNLRPRDYEAHHVDSHPFDTSGIGPGPARPDGPNLPDECGRHAFGDKPATTAVASRPVTRVFVALAAIYAVVWCGVVGETRPRTWSTLRGPTIALGSCGILYVAAAIMFAAT
jgi:hypothetical protein